jgi:hypothetical protein
LGGRESAKAKPKKDPKKMSTTRGGCQQFISRFLGDVKCEWEWNHANFSIHFPLLCFSGKLFFEKDVPTPRERPIEKLVNFCAAVCQSESNKKGRADENDRFMKIERNG